MVPVDLSTLKVYFKDRKVRFGNRANIRIRKCLRSTIPHKNNETNDTFYRKVAFLMYTEMVNFRPQS